MLWSPSLTVVVARQQYGRRHSLAQESRTRSSSLEHRSLITAFACRSLLSLEDESVLESDHTVVSECLESNNKTKSYNRGGGGGLYNNLPQPLNGMEEL